MRVCACVCVMVEIWPHQNQQWSRWAAANTPHPDYSSPSESKNQQSPEWRRTSLPPCRMTASKAPTEGDQTLETSSLEWSQLQITLVQFDTCKNIQKCDSNERQNNNTVNVVCIMCWPLEGSVALYLTHLITSQVGVRTDASDKADIW